VVALRDLDLDAVVLRDLGSNQDCRAISSPVIFPLSRPSVVACCGQTSESPALFSTFILFKRIMILRRDKESLWFNVLI